VIQKWYQNPLKITPKIDAKKDTKKESINLAKPWPGAMRVVPKPNHFKRHPSE
jgi:hypothetical protein